MIKISGNMHQRKKRVVEVAVLCTGNFLSGDFLPCRVSFIFSLVFIIKFWVIEEIQLFTFCSCHSDGTTCRQYNVNECNLRQWKCVFCPTGHCYVVPACNFYKVKPPKFF